MKVLGYAVPPEGIAQAQKLIETGKPFTSHDVCKKLVPMCGHVPDIEQVWWLSEVQNQLCQKWRKAGLIARDGNKWVSLEKSS